MLGFSDEIRVAVRGWSNQLSSLESIERVLTFDKFKCLMAAILSMLYAASFSDDQKNNYLRCILTRVSVGKFAVCRLLSVWIGTVTACISGFVFCAFVLKAAGIMDLRIQSGNMVAMRFLPLASGNFAVFYLLLLGANFGMAVSVACVLGMCLSVFRTDRFLAIGGSILAFYFLYGFSQMLPTVVSYEAIGSRMFEPEAFSNAGLILYHFGFLGLCFIAAGFVFYVTLKRRWIHGRLV